MQIRCYCSPSVLDLTTSCDDDEFDEFNYSEDDDDNDDKKKWTSNLQINDFSR